MRKLLLAAVVMIAACNTCHGSPSPDAWPALPRSNEEARVIFAGTGKRPTTESDAALDSAANVDVVKTNLMSFGAVAGWEAIDAQLARWTGALPDKSVVVAFGSSHDSPAQIDAFRRLVGPRSKIGWTRIVLEQLYADGHWKGADAIVQSGDDAMLERYATSGSRDDIAAILSRVERDTYTAWKYGSVDVIGDLVAEARAAGRPVSGCDMPPALRAKLASIDEDWVHRMREVHCALAMRDRAKKEAGAQRIAVLWGRMHAHADRFPRLVPADWTSFSVSMLDAPDDKDVILVDPVLLSNGRLVVASLNGAKHFERKRTKASGVTPPSRFSFTTKVRDPTAWIDGKHFDGDSTTVQPGRHLLAVSTNGTMIGAALDVPPNGAVDVTVADDAPEVTVTIIEPKSP